MPILLNLDGSVPPMGRRIYSAQELIDLIGGPIGYTPARDSKFWIVHLLEQDPTSQENPSARLFLNNTPIFGTAIMIRKEDLEDGPSS